MHSKTSSTQSLFIDYGSGYNPKKGYKTCDFTTNPCLDYNVIDYKIYNKDGELPHKSVSIFRLRNVIHHIPPFRFIIHDKISSCNTYALSV